MDKKEKIIKKLREITNRQFRRMKLHETYKAQAEEQLKKVKKLEELVKVYQKQLLELE